MPSRPDRPSKADVKQEHPNPPSESPLTVAVSTTPEGSLLTVTGELDADTAQLLDGALTDALQSGDVDVDLGGLSFMDSSGIRTLLAALDRCGEGQRLSVVAASPQATRLIEIVGAAGILGLPSPE